MNGNVDVALTALGWSEFFSSRFREFEHAGLMPARIARQERERFLLCGAGGESAGVMTGAMRRAAVETGPPVVGDWVAVRPRPGEELADIHGVVPRGSAISRREAGQLEREQVLAANVDVAFLVMGLDPGRSFNPRRLERLVVAARRGSCEPVVLLNKADLHEDPGHFVAEAELAAPGARVHAVSAASGANLDAVRSALGPGRTGVFLGPSGAGKSSLINALLGAGLQETREVRAWDGRGRHATAVRELFAMTGGGLLIDTPGLREVRLWADDEDVDEAYPEIAELSRACRFRDCGHASEPGCAVHVALAEGRLDPARYESYLELLSEARFQQDRAGYLEVKREKFRRIAIASRKWRKGRTMDHD